MEFSEYDCKNLGFLKCSDNDNFHDKALQKAELKKCTFTNNY